GGKLTVSPSMHRKILPFNDQLFLCEVSSDTIFNLSRDLKLTPFIVRTPALKTMNPHICMVLRLVSERYIFMETIKVEYDWDNERGFPRAFVVYDAKEKVLSGYTVYNGDYSTKKEVYMNWLVPGNEEVESILMLPAFQLIESYEKGELKGQLKEIASTLNEDSNPVIMLIKHKKGLL
ncbi:MAG: 6-bladed beta-propeller, partial [Tannerellaceae bacterium]